MAKSVIGILLLGRRLFHILIAIDLSLEFWPTYFELLQAPYCAVPCQIDVVIRLK